MSEQRTSNPLLAAALAVAERVRTYRTLNGVEGYLVALADEIERLRRELVEQAGLLSRSTVRSLNERDRAFAEVEHCRAEIEQLRAQLPEGMKNCFIRFYECANGHGRLTALNWVQHGCYVCELAAANKRVAELEREVRYLRAYGNKDCTAQAEEAMANRALEQEGDRT